MNDHRFDLLLFKLKGTLHAYKLVGLLNIFIKERFAPGHSKGLEYNSIENDCDVAFLIESNKRTVNVVA